MGPLDHARIKASSANFEHKLPRQVLCAISGHITPPERSEQARSKGLDFTDIHSKYPWGARSVVFLFLLPGQALNPLE